MEMFEAEEEEELDDPRQICQNRYYIFKFAGIGIYDVSLIFTLAEVYRRKWANEQYYNLFLIFVYVRPLLLVVYSTFITFCTGRLDPESETKKKAKIGAMTLDESQFSDV